MSYTYNDGVSDAGGEPINLRQMFVGVDKAHVRKGDKR
jgi:hypothetical protein